MKRYIKFRGQRVDNGEWVYGGYSMAEEDDGTLYVFILDCCSTAKFTDEDTEFTGHRIKPRTLGQFTGLKDKNGVEIYEGDIVRYETNYDLMCFEVKWNKDTLMWEAASQLIVDEPLYYNNGFIEIIGNIYDNPEMIELL